MTITIEGVARRYVKKPEAIEAIQLTRTNVNFLANWCGGRVVRESKPSDRTDVYIALDMPHLDGILRAIVGDYITKDEHGVFGRTKAEIFEISYQREGITANIKRLEAEWHSKTQAALSFPKTRS